MRRAALSLLGLIVFCWLGFAYFPGHSYLRGASQLYVPILERLASPGYLSRDLVATHPNVTYTVYDEVSLFLREIAGLDFRTALLLQQLLVRLAWLGGLYLIARACSVGRVWSLLTAAITSLGANLSGASVALIDPEPVPRAFALGLTVLATGFLAGEKPLLAALAGGLALVYDARVAALFWIVLLLAFGVDRQLRYLLRPCLPILLVFALILANLAQLQPGAGEQQDLTAKLTPLVESIQRIRTPWVWVSEWAAAEIWHYLAILVIGFWATCRIWHRLNRQLRWLIVCLPVSGVFCIPISFLLLEKFRWALIAQLEPAKTLVFTVAFCLTACALAGVHALQKRTPWEAAVWFALLFLIQINVRILDVWKLNVTSARQLGLALAFGIVLAFGAMRLKRAAQPAMLVVPVIATFVLPLATPACSPATSGIETRTHSLQELSDWAARDTWAGSVFAFPDAWKGLQPGVFRADSQRALWVDWESGALSIYSESFAREWWERWGQMMRPKFSAEQLQPLLSLPVDYCVLKRENALTNQHGNRRTEIEAVFANDDFVVYDTNQLRNVSGKLQRTKERHGG
jgi:hypothetical protein